MGGGHFRTLLSSSSVHWVKASVDFQWIAAEPLNYSYEQNLRRSNLNILLLLNAPIYGKATRRLLRGLQQARLESASRLSEYFQYLPIAHHVQGKNVVSTDVAFNFLRSR